MIRIAAACPAPRWHRVFLAMLATSDRALRRLIADVDPKTGQCRKPDALADVQERIRVAEQEATRVREEIQELKRQVIDEKDVKAGLAAFDPIWDSLTSAEQAKLFQLLVEKVVYDGKESTVSVTFRPTGIKELADGNIKAQGKKKK